MKVFKNDCDHYIAADIDDAWKAFEELTGEKRADYDDEFVEVPGDTIIKILCEDGRPSDSGELVERTAAEWAEREPRGMLCSTEF